MAEVWRSILHTTLVTRPYFTVGGGIANDTTFEAGTLLCARRTGGDGEKFALTLDDGFADAVASELEAMQAGLLEAATERMAACTFEPASGNPLVVDTFQNCEGLARVAFMDGNGVVLLGKVLAVEHAAT